MRSNHRWGVSGFFVMPLWYVCCLFSCLAIAIPFTCSRWCYILLGSVHLEISLHITSSLGVIKLVHYYYWCLLSGLVTFFSLPQIYHLLYFFINKWIIMAVVRQRLAPGTSLLKYLKKLFAILNGRTNVCDILFKQLFFLAKNFVP